MLIGVEGHGRREGARGFAVAPEVSSSPVPPQLTELQMGIWSFRLGNGWQPDVVLAILLPRVPLAKGVSVPSSH